MALARIYRSADMQILLSRVKNLGFLAQSCRQTLFSNSRSHLELPRLIGALSPVAGPVEGSGPDSNETLLALSRSIA